MKERKEKNGIIYCISRALVEEVCSGLCERGYNASRYHAGLSDTERRINQDDFIFDRVQIMVATNAFGMGIDKSNVSFVVHYNMPKDIESYYQEAGRAGRDGEPADCLLLWGGKDINTNTWLIENSRDIAKMKEGVSPEQVEQSLENSRAKLREMTFYSTTNDCLRRRLLNYFGETPASYCGNCSNCNTHFETVDVTVMTQKILSCVGRLNQRFGIKMIVDVLRGNAENRILELELNKLSTYGICADISTGRIRDIINHLIISDYLVKTDSEYPVIRFGTRANEVLRESGTVSMKLPVKDNIRPKQPKSVKQSVVLKPFDKRLFEVLRRLRLTIANEQNAPAFTVFSDSTLTDMCIKLPATPEEFLTVSGVGNVKCEKYGERFLKCISEFNI